MKMIKIHPGDNCLVALDDVKAGEVIEIPVSAATANALCQETAGPESGITRASCEKKQDTESESEIHTAIRVALKEDIPRGHKAAIREIDAGEPVIKYGCRIGIAAMQIHAGEWIHTHNVRTALSEEAEYAYHHEEYELPAVTEKYFMGFRWTNDRSYGDSNDCSHDCLCDMNNTDEMNDESPYAGKVGIRNEIWIIPSVGCVNGVVSRLAQQCQDLICGSIDGIYAFTHPFGCSQMGEDHLQTGRLLSSLVHHPNAGGVLVVGLGCENLQIAQLRELIGDIDESRVKFMICQECEDELAEGRKLLTQIAEKIRGRKREKCPVSDLVIGMKCGGSDGLSGITANPVVGRFSDRMIAMGGSTVLTEVPEMFGAEALLLNRCRDKDTFDKAVSMINGFKQYFVSHGQVVYENPSPGNKKGGITTLEDKSCGCVQKGGSAQIVDVLPYAGRVRQKGLQLLCGPGNDLVSATALTAAGCHMVLFTTGRGTPFAAPAPTVKISTGSTLAGKKANWIDFNAGTVAEGESPDLAGERLVDYVIEVANGKQTNAERMGYREISIWKDGIVL